MSEARRAAVLPRSRVLPSEAVYFCPPMGKIRSEEGAIFEAARGGDAGAVEAMDRLVRGFARDVCAKGLPRGSSDFDWEDVAQEASRQVLTRGLAQFRGKGSERSYLYSIVKTTAIQMVRASRRRSVREETYAADRPVRASRTHHRIDVRSLLDRIGPECRMVIERILLRGETYTSLARELGLAEPSVRSKLSRCLDKARKIAGTGETS